MRSRIDITKRWESLTYMSSVFGVLGMGAQKAAYHISIVAETAAMNFQEFVAGLLDLVKAFETVPHFILAALARLLTSGSASATIFESSSWHACASLK